jgi:hypothetical protein
VIDDCLCTHVHFIPTMQIMDSLRDYPFDPRQLRSYVEDMAQTYRHLDVERVMTMLKPPVSDDAKQIVACRDDYHTLDGYFHFTALTLAKQLVLKKTPNLSLRWCTHPTCLTSACEKQIKTNYKHLGRYNRYIEKLLHSSYEPFDGSKHVLPQEGELVHYLDKLSGDVHAGLLLSLDIYGNEIKVEPVNEADLSRPSSTISTNVPNDSKDPVRPSTPDHSPAMHSKCIYLPRRKLVCPRPLSLPAALFLCLEPHLHPML